MGKYALLCQLLSTFGGMQLSESTIRSIRDAYKSKDTRIDFEAAKQDFLDEVVATCTTLHT